MPDKVETSEELEKRYPGYAFRYTSPQALTKHAISNSCGYPPRTRAAICGASPVWHSPQGWRGTGNREEYEHNDKLRLCKRCQVKLNGGSFGLGLYDKKD